MSDEPAILAKIREALEGMLAPRDAARVLLDALASFGPRVPAELEELTEFVNGPLRAALHARVSQGTTLLVMRKLEAVLETASAPTATHGVPLVWPDEDTHDVPVLDSAVPVLVVAARGALATRLAGALGPSRIDARSAAKEFDLELAIAWAPLVVVIDASDVAPIRADALLAALARLPASTTVIVWGGELAYGRRLAQLAAPARLAMTTLRLDGGIDALLDLVLARRTSDVRDDADLL